MEIFTGSNVILLWTSNGGSFMKRILSVVVSFVFVLLTLTTNINLKAYAFPGNYFWYPREMHVRIYHPSSGMYLGIDRNGNEVDGARIQLQRYEEGNQNQIFYLKAIDVDKSGHVQYQIRVHGESEMVIEIRNGSHEDWAEAAQWTTHSGDCAKWYFFTETNRNGYDSALCCIKNVESDKLLNVSGNEGYDGNNLIQYHEDNTQAEVFQVFSVEDNIIGAMWSRDWGQNDNGSMYWSMVEDTKKNRQKYFTPINVYNNGYIGYPVQYDETVQYLATVIWADANLQKKLLQLHNPPKDAWQLIKDALGGTGREYVIDSLFSATPLGAVPVGDIEGVISTIMVGQSEQQWYLIEKAFATHSKVRIEIYYVFDAGNWGVSCKALVNDQIDTYWDGSKSAIGNSVNMNYSGIWINGNVEYFYK